MNIKLSILALSLLATPIIAQDDAVATPDPTPEPDVASLMIPTVTIDPDADATLRIARAHTGQILIPATINGNDHGWWLLDTGTSDTLIDSRMATELGLESAGTVITRDFNGIEQTSPLFKDITIKFANCTIEQPRVTGVDVFPISGMIAQPVIGIIGVSTLSQIVLELDYLAPVARIHHPDSFDEGDRVWTDISFARGCPVVECSFEGNPGSYVVNTGLGMGISFSRDEVIKHSMTEGRETREWASVGVGGRKDVWLGFVHDFEFLGTKYTDLTAIFEDPEGYEGAFPEQAGMIGSLILRDYVTTFDLGRSRIAFTPVERAEPADDLMLADIVGTYRDRATGGTMVLDWDGEKVTAILGTGQPDLEVRIFSDATFYFPAAWISGRFGLNNGQIKAIHLKLSDGQTRRAKKMD